ncbi:hydrogenase formation protein HypD [Comamonadaceae bacterium G21597-S1]|nr:hydrogenase formation protein HypD [Comamonadaceae bacterium G21597-S1]
MKYVDEFRDPAKARALVRDITQRLDGIAGRLQRPLQIMEVCGGHTHSIFRYGIHRMLPPTVEFVHGPGCPVCVLPMGRVDDAIALARQPGMIFATFGDAMRVPGSTQSLLQARADGADVRMVYSPLDALQLARDNPTRPVVFFGLGFETTMPATAMTLLQARADRVPNFSVFCNHITIIPTLRAMLDEPDLQIDGFLGPGHVSMVIGVRCYDFIARDYHRPLTVAGFEPLDLLQAVSMVINQIADGRCEVENQYRRIVPEHGNPQALAAMATVFEPRDTFEWRGLGSIAHSGVRLREDFAAFDAERIFTVPHQRVADPGDCQCAEVLKGRIRPPQCRLFGTACTPQTPLGALMVSSEGACAAHYRYARHATPAATVATEAPA